MRLRAPEANSAALLAAVFVLANCGSGSAQESGDLPETDLPVLEVLDRPAGFTQGFEVLADGQWLMSSGGYGDSEVVITQGDEVIRSQELPPEEFGEGISVVGDTAYQLTWQAGVVHTWSVPDLAEGQAATIAGQGWGLCFDESAGGLWLSDGSSSLTLHDPDTFNVISQIAVTDAGQPVEQLNELECIDGLIWANVWRSNDLVVIDPSDGAMVNRVDLSDLAADQAKDDPGHVLNGIAYDADSDTLLVTGKEWDAVYRLDYSELSPRP